MFKVGDRVEIIDSGSAPPETLGCLGVVKRVLCDHYDVDVDRLGTWSYVAKRLKKSEAVNCNKFLKELSNSVPPIMILTEPIHLTLPTDSEARKQIPMFSGCIKYFPAAIAGVAKISKAGNDKHNPGQELHHDRSKSLDHADCIVRHLADVADLIAKLERGENTNPEQILAEVSSLAWRALAYSQTLHEKYDGAPLAPGAK